MVQQHCGILVHDLVPFMLSSIKTNTSFAAVCSAVCPFNGLRLSAELKPDKCSCLLLHIMMLPITSARAPTTTTNSRTTGAISSLVAADKNNKNHKVDKWILELGLHHSNVLLLALQEH